MTAGAFSSVRRYAIITTCAIAIFYTIYYGLYMTDQNGASTQRDNTVAAIDRLPPRWQQSKKLTNRHANKALDQVIARPNGANCSFSLGARFFPLTRGLGNNMFVYASALGLINDCNRKVAQKTTICPYIVDYDARLLLETFESLTVPHRIEFDSNAVDIDFDYKHDLARTFWGPYKRDFMCMRNAKTNNFMQSYRYFHKKFGRRLRNREFVFKAQLREAARSFFLNISMDRRLGLSLVEREAVKRWVHSESRFSSIHFVGIHLRIFFEFGNVEAQRVEAQIALKKGAKRIRQMIVDEATTVKSKSERKSMRFLIVYIISTNDPEFLRNIILRTTSRTDIREVTVVTAHYSDSIAYSLRAVTADKWQSTGTMSKAVDMLILSMCQKILLTVPESTFGWWAAYLSNASTVLYVQPGNNGSKEWRTPEDYFLPEWTSLVVH